MKKLLSVTFLLLSFSALAQKQPKVVNETIDNDPTPEFVPKKKKSPSSPDKRKGLIGHAVEKSENGYYGMSGCGLGSILFGETEHRGGQLLSATTNGFYSNATFGMSSGTSNCVPEKSEHAAEVKKNMDMFVAANREALANDIVKSNGDTLTAMSEIMGCSDKDYLGTKLQSRYETIFATKNDSEVSTNMFNTVTSDRYLVENCKL